MERFSYPWASVGVGAHRVGRGPGWEARSLPLLTHSPQGTRATAVSSSDGRTVSQDTQPGLHSCDSPVVGARWTAPSSWPPMDPAHPPPHPRGSSPHRGRNMSLGLIRESRCRSCVTLRRRPCARLRRRERPKTLHTAARQKAGCRLVPAGSSVCTRRWSRSPAARHSSYGALPR